MELSVREGGSAAESSMKTPDWVSVVDSHDLKDVHTDIPSEVLLGSQAVGPLIYRQNRVDAAMKLAEMANHTSSFDRKDVFPSRSHWSLGHRP